MKKLISLIAAVAIIGSAHAFQPAKSLKAADALKVIKTEKTVKNTPVKEFISIPAKKAKVVTQLSDIATTKTLNQTLAPQKTAPGQNSSIKMGKKLSARKIDGTGIEGSWVFTFYDILLEGATFDYVDVTFICSYNSQYDVYFFEDPTNYELPIMATYDASTNVLTFPSEIIGTVQTEEGVMYFSQEFSTLDPNASELVELDELTVTFNPATKSLDFDGYDIIEWGAYSDTGTQYQYQGTFWAYVMDGAEMGEGAVGGGGDGSIEGTWRFAFGDYYFQNSVGGTIYVNFNASKLESGVIYFKDPTNYYLPFEGTFNEATGKINFNRVYLGEVKTGSNGETMDAYQSPFQFDYTTGNITSINTLTGTVDLQRGTISFNADQGIAWEAYSGETLKGYFKVFDFEGATKGNGGSGNDDSDTDWTTIGEATFMDGWLLPAFGMDQTNSTYWYKVPLQQNNSNKNRYRLVDPYHLGPISTINESTTKGYIVFDVTDPNAVLFEKSVAGFAYSQLGITSFYCYNTLGTYYQQYRGQYSPTEIVNTLGAYIPLTTFKDGVVSLGSKVVDGKITYDANFGLQTATDGGRVWQDNSGNLVNMTAAIYFPEGFDAVEEIISDNNSAKAEYFNLQGARILNPEAGQILIKRQGTKVEKVVY